LRQGVRLDDAYRLHQLAVAAEFELMSQGQVKLNGEDISEAIRTPEVSAAASKIAAVGGVRTALVAKQREIGERRNVVMEGRDIGTVVFPEARVKIFLDADPEERVRRRAMDQPEVTTKELAAQITERDARDRHRVESPLVQAPDASYLNSTGLTQEEVVEEILKIVRARISNGKEH
jgi:cytidylate kinase